MEIKEFSKIIIEKGNYLEIKFNENQIEKFYKYMNMLIEWNKKVNLTAITDCEEIILKHFIDSLTILKYIKNESKVIDVGTGAGFPGIPLKIMKEDIEITLVDSLNKRINFLNNIIEELELKNIKTIHTRTEDIGNDNKNREKYDIVVSRAVAKLSTLVEYMLPLIKKDGMCICMKGANIEDELKNSKNAVKILGGKIKNIEEIELTTGDNKRNNIIIEKIKNTPNKYPRKAGIPSKNPIE